VACQLTLALIHLLGVVCCNGLMASMLGVRILSYRAWCVFLFCRYAGAQVVLCTMQIHGTPDSTETVTTMRQVGHPPEAPKVFCFSQSDEWVDLDAAAGGGALGERGERASLLQRQ